MLQRKYYLLPLLMLAAVLATNAQTKIKPVVIQKSIKLPTSQEAAKIFNREKVRIAPLSQAAKNNIVNDALKDKGITKTDSLTLPVKLSTTNPKPGADNFLMYFKPWNVLVTGDQVQFSQTSNWGDSSLVTAYRPPAPGYYLFDFSVKEVSETSFTLFTLDGKTKQTQNYQPGADQYAHITFVVNFAEAKQQALVLLADQDWSFYECEISQIK